MRKLFSLLALFGLVSCATAEPPATISAAVACPAPPAGILQLDYRAFDQSEAGWRSLDDRGCEGSAADVVRQYRELNAATLGHDETETLTWHEAQLRAADGQYGDAARLFSDIRAGKAEPMDQAYLDATIAFLSRDRSALLRARETLAALPEPPAFARAADNYAAKYNQPRPTWPPNLDIVDRLLACFDRTYQEAYQECELSTDVAVGDEHE